MPAVTRRSAAEVAYLKSAAATDPPRRIERLFFRFETLVDSERDANWSTVRPAVSRLSTYLPQFESSAAYNLTVNQNVHAVGANPKRAGVKVVNALIVVDLRRGQRPAGGKRRAESACNELKIVQIPNRGLTCARIEQDEIRLAIAVKIRRADQSPSGRQSRTVGAVDKHVFVHVPDCRLPRARIEQEVIIFAVAVKIGRPDESPSSGQRRAPIKAEVNVVVHVPDDRLARRRVKVDIVRFAVAVEIGCANHRPSGLQSRTVGAAHKHVVVHVPDGRLQRGWIKEEIIRFAILIEIGDVDQTPPGRQSRAVGAGHKHVVVHVPDRRLPRARIEQEVIIFAVAIEIEPARRPARHAEIVTDNVQAYAFRGGCGNIRALAGAVKGILHVQTRCRTKIVAVPISKITVRILVKLS